MVDAELPYFNDLEKKHKMLEIQLQTHNAKLEAKEREQYNQKIKKLQSQMKKQTEDT